MSGESPVGPYNAKYISEASLNEILYVALGARNLGPEGVLKASWRHTI